MKRLLAIALALSSTAALAAPGDAWHGTNRGIEYERRVVPIEVTRADPVPIYVYEGRVIPPADAVVVERVYEPAYAPRDVIVYRDSTDWVDALNPNTDRRLGRGLFPRQGPNDFGN